MLLFGSTGESSLPHSEMRTAYLQRFSLMYIYCPPQLCLYDAEHRITAGVSTNSKRRIAMTSNKKHVLCKSPGVDDTDSAAVSSSITETCFEQM